ncbi:DUF4251 domain-containing protein [uncultured Bacteroides sp.]|uniref:DUF4251 domain-containing protein n=1 Tax=uncultured Bacteroides sp. TaxID=162156 RepID=UPI00267537ED|nr:DUF4251 domain-containing protein [uncultured Bacteroides sp.]
MKRITTFVMMFLFAGIGYINAQTVQKEKEMTREEEKAQKEMLDQLYYEEAKKAIEEKQFILEADQVMFKYGTTAFVTSNTNFVAVQGNKAVVQVAFNIPISGPNGLGGVTVSGNISNYKLKTDKKGNTHISMNVMGTGISALVNIDLPKGSNQATVDISPNFNSNRFTLRGTLLPIVKANVFQGRTL